MKDCIGEGYRTDLWQGRFCGGLAKDQRDIDVRICVLKIDVCSGGIVLRSLGGVVEDLNRGIDRRS